MKEKLKAVIEAVKFYESGELQEDFLKSLIIDYISDDENIIPNLLRILERERINKQNLLIETNLELSRALVGLQSFDKNTKTDKEQRLFIIDKIKEHYIKWKEYIRCCFKVKELP